MYLKIQNSDTGAIVFIGLKAYFSDYGHVLNLEKSPIRSEIKIQK